MVMAQKLKAAEITEQDSLLLTRNLLRIAIYNISYIRGLFSEKYFSDKSVPALELKIKKLMPVDAESRRLIDWMEKGVYDALQKKYLKTLLFSICETVDGPTIEEYAFSFSYPNPDSQDVSMNINRTGNKRQGEKFNCTNEVTPNQMKSSACKMIRTLVQLMRTLDKIPEERTILMKLLYYEDVTPPDYEPPFFRECTEEETHNQWTKNPLKMEVGNVNSKHFVLALKVRSVLDPCENDNDKNMDESVSMGVDSTRRDNSSDSGSEVSSSQADQYIVAAVEQGCQDDIMVSEGETQNPAEDENHLLRVKDWINSSHFETLEVTDVLANFPDISVVLIEGITEKLVAEGFLSKVGKDKYAVNKPKELEYEFNVKEVDDQVLLSGDKNVFGPGEDYMYMQALYHALPMEYVTTVKLQTKLEGKANQTAVKKLIDKMARDGFLEATSNRKLGKRVIHSLATEQKLNEVRKALEYEVKDEDVPASQSKFNQSKTWKNGNKKADLSTCGALQSIGSDITRMRARSESTPLQNGSLRSGQSIDKAGEHPHTPTSKAGPVASRESTIPACGESRLGRTNNTNDDVICSRPSHERRSRKASTVQEPIIQYCKRQKSQPV
ncbi:hypothetical protein RND81_11G147400 [Saponaria officinalis]|uniref:HORMA domain-containing protein n=1 Tax=Saponaria officinalis TaxID=3572 RepID=A0AAW1HM58_SAPOF